MASPVNHLQMASAGTDPSDVELIRRARDGDREAFAEIYRRYQHVVFRFARTMSGSASIAEDATQETFVAVMRDLERYEPQRSGLSTYLYGIVRNVTRDRLRKDRRFVNFDADAGPEPAVNDDPGAAMARAQQLARLRRAIAALPSRYREVVILCELHGVSYVDAAAIIKAPVGTVRSRLHRARKMIAEQIQSGRATSIIGAAARCLA